jgi:hypothetical protein
MPAFHWRQILSAHNTPRPGGMSINMELDKLFHWGSNHRLVLSLPNSYATDDGVAVHTWTDDGGSQSQAKAQVCKAALVELLLRAPYRGAVRLLTGAQLTRNRWNVERIWYEVSRLQLQMHGFTYVVAAPDMGGAGINAAPPPSDPQLAPSPMQPSLAAAPPPTPPGGAGINAAPPPSDPQQGAAAAAAAPAVAAAAAPTPAEAPPPQ